MLDLEKELNDWMAIVKITRMEHYFFNYLDLKRSNALLSILRRVNYKSLDELEKCLADFEPLQRALKDTVCFVNADFSFDETFLRGLLRDLLDTWCGRYAEIQKSHSDSDEPSVSAILQCYAYSIDKVLQQIPRRIRCLSFDRSAEDGHKEREAALSAGIHVVLCSSVHGELDVALSLYATR